MNKVKKYIKTHKKGFTILAVILVLMIILAVSAYSVISYLMPDTRASVYGDRCELTSEHPVRDELEDKIKEFLKDYDTMTLSKLDVKCNLIDVIVIVDGEFNVTNIKAMGKALLQVFSEDELKYYDIELYVNPKSEKDENVLIGSHHKEIDGVSNDDFVW